MRGGLTMANEYSPMPGYAIIIAGVVLAFISAVIPFYNAEQLNIGVLMAGLLPYMVYGFAVVLLRHPLTIITGLVLLFLHGWLVYHERFELNADYSSGMIYLVPIALALVLITLAAVALRQPWHK
jgi:hypothetical protein